MTALHNRMTARMSLHTKCMLLACGKLLHELGRVPVMLLFETARLVSCNTTTMSLNE